MRRSFLFLVLPLAPAVALAALGGACATGGSSAGSSDGGGDDSTVDGVAPGDGAIPEGSDAKPSGDGGTGTSLTQACNDNAAHYCNQLSMCSPFLLSVDYGDVVTCQTRLGGAYCNGIVTAKGSGWTGDGLEACVAARDMLSCTDFLYKRPAPAACRPAGTLSTGSCLFDSQCGTGYCRITSGMTCGNCVARGNTGSPCVTTTDCDSNLVCAGPAGSATCVVPLPLGGICSAMTAPCESGEVCLHGRCAQPAAVGMPCSADAGGIDCDYNLGAYCDGTACAAVSVATLATPCGGSPPVACLGNGACQGGVCVLPVPDGQPCDGGLNCTTPSSCYAGSCSTPSATQCP